MKIYYYASLLLLPLLTTTATDPNPSTEECCDLANDETTCLAYTSHATTSFDNCVGGIGVDCDGVPQDFNFGSIGTLSVNLVRPQDHSDGLHTTIKTSVGSILHDLCCMEHPNGAFCTSSNYPIDETINAFGNANNNCYCIMEWRKAAWNLLRGRYWLETFELAQSSSDTRYYPDASTDPNLPALVRKSYLPKGSGTNYISYKSDWGLTERYATAALCAPAGTKLDCPSEDNNCKVPCIWTSCRACNKNDDTDCKNSQNNRWNDNDRNHATAGDSDYCCSGRFKEVYWNLSGTRYGVCA